MPVIPPHLRLNPVAASSPAGRPCLARVRPPATSCLPPHPLMHLQFLPFQPISEVGNLTTIPALSLPLPHPIISNQQQTMEIPQRVLKAPSARSPRAESRSQLNPVTATPSRPAATKDSSRWIMPIRRVGRGAWMTSPRCWLRARLNNSRGSNIIGGTDNCPTGLFLVRKGEY